VNWQERYAEKRTTPTAAVRRIPCGQCVFISSGAAEPIGLVQALVDQAGRFVDTHIVHLLTLGPAPYVEPKYEGNFRHNAFFIGGNVRSAVHAGRADYTPVFLSRIPSLIRSRRMPVDVALIQCSPPDDYGYVNLGVSVDIGLAAIESAHTVIAEINPNVPVIHGAGFLSFDRIDAWIFNDVPMVTHDPQPLDQVSLEIGRNVAALVDDGCTIQTGIGQIPDATLKALADKNDLGLWTEMFSDGVLDLIEAGVINGRYKTIHPHKVSSSFTFGSQRLYDFVHRNPAFTFHPSDYINDPVRVARQHKMVAINSALQVDLTGQVCADSLGTKFYSGIGGQVDFIRGASMCPGGKPIIALPSTASGGRVSRIAATLSEGAGVVTSRGDVRFVVTEYGSADLLGKSIRERALALISIAHPDFRAELLAAAKNRHYVFVDQIEPRALYPRQQEKKVRTKRDVPVLLRPIRPIDEGKLQDLFYSLSDTTLYQRFQRVIKCIPHSERRYYLDVDYKKNMALVGETCGEDRDPEIVGVAQYFLDSASGFAEASFVIRDAWQRQGLGTAMISHLISIARENGIKGLTADVLASNGAMLHVFYKSGLKIHSTLVEGVYRLNMPFSRPGKHSHEEGRLQLQEA
jgi:acyl-CoA hydrolase/GNAT superfamily N-acetyltransferase